MRPLLLIVTLCLLLTSATAQQSPATPSPQQASAQLSNAPVPVPEPSEKAVSYYRSGVALWIVNILWGLLMPAFFLFTGFSARIRDWAKRGSRGWYLVIGVYFATFFIIIFVIDFPLRYYQDYARERTYGLSNQTLGKWLGDETIELLIGAVVGFLLPWVPYLLLKKSPRRWWLYTGLLATAFLILSTWAAPEMKNKELDPKILRLAEQVGIEGDRVYAVAISENTKTVNAYVTGFGATKRIVLWDTIIAKLDEDELLFIMGHEMGHYVLGHVWKSILFSSLLIIATLYAIHRTAGWLINKFHRRFGFTELSDVASWPLIILLFNAYFLIVGPIALAYSRHNEHEADRFGLEITRNNRAAATAFVKLQQENLAVPRSNILVKLWQSSHPTFGERIDFANEYRPWEKGEALRYGDLFK
ncbi:MAG TPA: M48 family metallopeptidase [Blastocatellia bacterium]|nr:M48 family metallopeptidase [Blastocatellia bacterium]